MKYIDSRHIKKTALKMDTRFEEKVHMKTHGQQTLERYTGRYQKTHGQ